MTLKSKLSFILIFSLVAIVVLFFLFRGSISSFFLNKAQSSIYQNKLNQAETYLNVVKIINKNSARYHFLAANVALLQKKYEEAVPHYEAALEFGFTPREYPLGKLATYYHLIAPDYSKSLPLYLEVDSLKPNDLLITQRLAEIYFVSDKFNDSAEYTKKAISLVENNQYDPTKFVEQSILLSGNYAFLGRIYYQEKQYEKSAEAYKKSLELSPNQPLIATRYARALKHLGDINGAIAEINKVLATNPDYKQALCALSGIYVEAKDYDKAIEAAEKALKDGKIGADNISCLYHSATAYYNKGDFSSAKSDLEKLSDNFTKLSLTSSEYQGLKSSAEDLLTKIK